MKDWIVEVCPSKLGNKYNSLSKIWANQFDGSMKPITLDECIALFINNFLHYDTNYQFRIRNVKTNEVIPCAAIT